MPSRGNVWHRRLSRILFGGVTLQIFFAGLGIFGVSGFWLHAILGSVVIGASLVLPIVAWRAHLGQALLARSWMVVGLMVLQGLLIDLGRVSKIITAFHPVNAMLLALVLFALATRRV